MSGYLVVADDDKCVSIGIGPVYNGASIDKLHRDVDDNGWTVRGVIPHWKRADFNRARRSGQGMRTQ